MVVYLPINTSDIRSLSGNDIPDCDGIIGGPPCQTFSAAGARAAGVMGTDDARGNLFIEYARILEYLKPKGFLFENVYRIVGAQGGNPWKKIQQTFMDLGYKLFWRIIDAADYGVPQFRERLIIVGLKEGEYLFPKPTHGPDSTDRRPYYTAGEAVSNIPNFNVKQGDGLTGRHGKLLIDIPPGLNYSFYTEKMGHPHPIFAWRSKFSDYLYKADPKAPVRTIKAQGGQYTGPLSWENRYFSVEEYKRLQSFPDNYDIVGGRLKVIHQLGNSVPPQLARVLAISVMEQVFGYHYPFGVEYLSQEEKLGFRKRKSSLSQAYSEKASSALEKCQTTLNKTTIKPLCLNGEGHITINDDFSYSISEDKNNSSQFTYNYSFNTNQWTFNLFDNSTNKEISYRIAIIIPSFFKKEKLDFIININIFSHKKRTLTASWKLLEHYIREKYWKDDLIQFFGYYQNKRSYSMSMTIDNLPNILQNDWTVTQKIISGYCVGKMYTLQELIENWKISIKPEQLKSILEQLKKLGYEIRNHNTNPQIQKEQYLIPYSFATLNERSLQRLTNL